MKNKTKNYIITGLVIISVWLAILLIYTNSKEALVTERECVLYQMALTDTELIDSCVDIVNSQRRVITLLGGPVSQELNKPVSIENRELELECRKNDWWYNA